MKSRQNALQIYNLVLFVFSSIFCDSAVGNLKLIAEPVLTARTS